MFKNQIFINIIIYIFVSALIFIFSYSYIQKEENHLLNEKYQTIAQEMQKNTDALIKAKKNATLGLAVAASKFEEIKKVLQDRSYNINLSHLSLELREKTRFKNVWFQVFDDKGQSVYRSWTKTKGDFLDFREDVTSILKNKTYQTSISVGNYDMTFKSMIPIFEQGKFLGVLEIITHFNSISKTLIKDNIKAIIIANKSFKKNLIEPFTKKFIDDYYIANLDADVKLTQYIQTNGIENILSIKTFKVDKNQLITNYTIQSHNRIIGHAILCKDLNHIDYAKILSFKKTSLFSVFLLILILGFIFAIITYYTYSNKIKELYESVITQKEKNQQILDSQKNMILITDGETLQEANTQLYEFFPEYNNLEEFKKDHDCVCERFIDMDDEDYVVDIDYEGKNWAEHVLSHPTKNFKAAMKRYEKIHHFALSVNLDQFKNEARPFIIVNLTDITNEIQRQMQLQDLNENLEYLVHQKTKELQEFNDSLEERIQEEIAKNKEKDRLLFQQNKMAAMGEMLQNIAHQWRQPLSSISTVTSSIQLQKEMHLLEDGFLEESCEHIMRNTQYLSQTINDFQSFFQQDKTKSDFLLKEAVLDALKLIDDNFNSNEINIDINIHEDILIHGYKNEFRQAILNILQNANDALNSSDNKEKFIFIESHDHNLYIKDNAGGIQEDIIDKIFDPYFTTKHQSQGTGIGLYMTQEILQKHMDMTINVENATYLYKDKEYTGANFIITFPH